MRILCKNSLPAASLLQARETSVSEGVPTLGLSCPCSSDHPMPLPERPSMIVLNVNFTELTVTWEMGLNPWLGSWTVYVANGGWTAKLSSLQSSSWLQMEEVFLLLPPCPPCLLLHTILFIYTPCGPGLASNVLQSIGCKRRGGVVPLTPDFRMLAFLPATWSPATAI